MFQIGTFAVSWECSCSVPPLGNLGKFWGHCKHISNVPNFTVFLACACSVPRISPNFPKVVHCRNTPRTLQMYHLWYIALVLSKFPSLIHCDHTDGNTAKSL